MIALLVLALQPVLSEGRGARVEGEIRATPEGENLIRAVSPGRFETTFTKRKGFGAIGFDLKHDRAKKRDLAPVLDENGFFWIKIGKPGSDGSWYSNPPEEMTLLEAGPARVRVRLRGPHMRYGNVDPKNARKELRFDQTYTLYPDGSVFIAYDLEQAEPVVYHRFLVGWTGPATATAGGKPATVHVRDGTLLLQLSGTVKEDVALVIRP
jgi:hypothetical protein